MWQPVEECCLFNARLSALSALLELSVLPEDSTFTHSFTQNSQSRDAKFYFRSVYQYADRCFININIYTLLSEYVSLYILFPLCYLPYLPFKFLRLWFVYFCFVLNVTPKLQISKAFFVQTCNFCIDTENFHLNRSQ